MNEFEDDVPVSWTNDLAGDELEVHPFWKDEPFLAGWSEYDYE